MNINYSISPDKFPLLDIINSPSSENEEDFSPKNRFRLSLGSLPKISVAPLSVRSSERTAPLKERKFFNHTELLQKIADLLTKRNLNSIDEILDSLNAVRVSDLVFKTLKMHVGIPDAYNTFMNFLIPRFQLEEHLLIKDAQTRLISIEGLKVLVQHFREKGTLRFDCYCCASFTELEDRLASLNERADEPSFRLGILVKNAGGPPGLGLKNSPHITPVYIEKKEGKFFAVITDSMAEKGLYSYFVGESISKVLNIRPYDFETQRQKDPNNCSIFALKDIIHISKNPDFLKFIEEHISETTMEDAILFNRLPPSMMKVTQSLTLIQEYSDPHLAQSVQKHVGELTDKGGETHTINTFAASRTKKYERIITGKLIETRHKEKK